MLLAPDNQVHNTFAPFNIYLTYQYHLLTVMREEKVVLDIATCRKEKYKTGYSKKINIKRISY